MPLDKWLSLRVKNRAIYAEGRQLLLATQLASQLPRSLAKSAPDDMASVFVQQTAHLAQLPNSGQNRVHLFKSQFYRSLKLTFSC